jgi:hypothetical protein
LRHETVHPNISSLVLCSSAESSSGPHQLSHSSRRPSP